MAHDLPGANTRHPDVTPPHHADRVLRDAVRDLVEATDEVMRLETELAVAKEWRDALARHEVPDAMYDVGTETVAVDDKTTVTLERRLHCSILKAEKPNVLLWLKQIGRSDLLSVELSIEFPRSDYAKAKSFAAAIRDLREQYGVAQALKETWDIHSATLKKFVGESFFTPGKLDELPRGLTYYNDNIAVVKRVADPAPADEENPLT